jgi:hypothetical protein
MFRKLWNALLHLGSQPLTSARSADELSCRLALQPKFATLHDMGDLPAELADVPPGRPTPLVYSELDRRGEETWRAA